MTVLLTPDQARIALQTTKKAINLVDSTGVVRRTSDDEREVLAFLAAGHHFYGTLKRVKCIKFPGRVPDPLAPAVGRQSEPIETEKPDWRECWGTCESAVLPPSARFGLRPEQGRIITGE